MTKEEMALEMMENMRKLAEIHEVPDIPLGKAEVKALYYIQRFEEGVSPGEIANYMKVTSARVASIINSLQKKGIIERTTETSDRRRITVKSTEKGAEFIEQIGKMAISRIMEVFDAIGEEDAANFSRIIKKILAAKEYNLKFSTLKEKENAIRKNAQ